MTDIGTERTRTNSFDVRLEVELEASAEVTTDLEGGTASDVAARRDDMVPDEVIDDVIEEIELSFEEALPARVVSQRRADDHEDHDRLGEGPETATRRHRSRTVHEALSATRAAVVTSDVVSAVLVLLVSSTGWQSALTWALPTAWLGMMLLRSSVADRTAALLDRRPYLKTNAHLALGVTMVAATFGDLHATRQALLLAAVLTATGLATRSALRHHAVTSRLTREVRETVLVVGDRESVRRTIDEWHGLPDVIVVGACLAQADSGVRRIGDVPVLGSVSDIATVARQLGVDIVALHDVDQLGGLQLARLQYALEEAETQLSVITPVTNMRVDRASVRRLGRRVVVDVSYGTPRGVARFVKTVFDQCISAVLLAVSLPIMLVCAGLIRLTSSGPVLFKQVRVGEGGTTFTMYKFRTMQVDAEARLEALLDRNEVDGGLFKMAEDPRVTRAGRWLRRASLDELPQLLNVVRGQMSLIGPRPALPREVQTYDDAARRRLAVKPGMTGLWQVSGRSNLSWDETVRIDSDYVDNWRAGRELSIAVRTIKAVVTRNGAH